MAADDLRERRHFGSDEEATRQRARSRAAVRRRRLRGHPRLQRPGVQAGSPHRSAVRLGQGAAARDAAHARKTIERIVLDTCRRNDIVDGYIRLVVTRGVGDLGIDPRSCRQPGIIVIAQAGDLASIARRRAASQLVTSSLRRPSPDTLSPSIKSLNYVNNVLARMEANDRGADEALMLDVNGYVAEATADNVFIVTRRGLATPPTATNLDGITRETVLEIAARARIRCEERPFSLFEVWTAREVFVCGTGAEVVPVLSVDGRTIGSGKIGPTTRRDRRRLRQAGAIDGHADRAGDRRPVGCCPP